MSGVELILAFLAPTGPRTSRPEWDLAAAAIALSQADVSPVPQPISRTEDPGGTWNRMIRSICSEYRSRFPGLV